jgi:hypothetical protein
VEIPDNVCIDDTPRDDVLSNFPVELKDANVCAKSIIGGTTTLPLESTKKHDTVAETILLGGNAVSNESRMCQEPSNNEVVEISLSDSGTEQRDHIETHADARAKSIIGGTTLPPESTKKHHTVAETILLGGNGVSNESRMCQEPSNNEVVEVSLSDSGTEQKDHVETHTDAHAKSIIGRTTLSPESTKKHDSLSLDGNDVSKENRICEDPSNNEVVEVSLSNTGTELKDHDVETQSKKLQMENDSDGTTTRPISCDIKNQPNEPKPQTVIPNAPELENTTEEDTLSTTQLSNTPAVAYTSAADLARKLREDDRMHCSYMLGGNEDNEDNSESDEFDSDEDEDLMVLPPPI